METVFKTVKKTPPIQCGSGDDSQHLHPHVYGKKQSVDKLAEFMHLCQRIPAGFIVSRLSAEKNGGELPFLPKPTINQLEDSQLAWHPSSQQAASSLSVNQSR